MSLPLLQAPTVSIWSWSPDPVVAFLATGAIWLYARAIGPGRTRFPDSEPVPRWRQAAFYSGVATIVLALLSPLGVLGDDFLLSAHMVQHLLLTAVGPPLVLLGLPAWLVDALSRVWGGRPWRVWRVLTQPVLAFVLFHLPFSLYHVPVIYDLALENLAVHIAMHNGLIAASFLVWWPVLAPERRLGRMLPALAMLYLFVQTIPGQVVGAFITYAEKPLYAPYVDAPRVWGLSPLVDQQIGGLIMWIGTSTIYLSLLAIVFFRWASSEDRAHAGTFARAR